MVLLPRQFSNKWLSWQQDYFNVLMFAVFLITSKFSQIKHIPWLASCMQFERELPWPVSAIWLKFFTLPLQNRKQIKIIKGQNGFWLGLSHSVASFIHSGGGSHCKVIYNKSVLRTNVFKCKWLNHTPELLVFYFSMQLTISLY